MTIQTQTKAIAVALFALMACLGTVSMHAAQQVMSLHEAVERGDVAEVRRLLATDVGRAQVNEIDSRVINSTRGALRPLHVAIHCSRASMVRLLLEGGADPDGRTSFGALPLHFAVRDGHQEMAKQLLEHGADVYAFAHGSTALDKAIDARSLPIAQLLIDYGADISDVGRPAPRAPRKSRASNRRETRQNLMDKVRERNEEHLKVIKLCSKQLHQACGLSKAVVNQIILPMILTEFQLQDAQGPRPRDPMSSPQRPRKRARRS